jgi:hypothetical protein
LDWIWISGLSNPIQSNPKSLDIQVIHIQAEFLVKKQAKAIRKDLEKAAKPAKLPRRALVRSKIVVVVP